MCSCALIAVVAFPPKISTRRSRAPPTADAGRAGLADGDAGGTGLADGDDGGTGLADGDDGGTELESARCSAGGSLSAERDESSR